LYFTAKRLFPSHLRYFHSSLRQNNLISVLYRLSELDTIIFDLGEVIVDLDPKAVIDEFSRLTDGRGKNLRELIVGSPYLFEYETGQIDDHEFIRQINQLFQSEISYDEFFHAWNLMIKSIPENRLELMKKLQQTHRVLVLSNTNRMHEVKFEKMMMDTANITMRELADMAYYSHDIGRRKPNADIYEFVIDEQSLNPEKSLFLDDKKENIEAARTVGLKAEQVQFPDQIFDILSHE